MLSCFTAASAVLQQAFNKLNEGGWLEIQDGLGFLFGQDESFKGTALQRWIQLAIHGRNHALLLAVQETCAECN
ncbi:hypothetical protein BJ878DRAFT_106316 [Calycina marina]|uniref:Uncharacterized protein n=1 Tax=Calycina marina TaxID=1763456 RepID=A0A9P7Z9X5_9HELO|nr:hypothetical protein BJ878DRAFT_106316 [Calycina marina]